VEFSIKQGSPDKQKMVACGRRIRKRQAFRTGADTGQGASHHLSDVIARGDMTARPAAR